MAIFISKVCLYGHEKCLLVKPPAIRGREHLICRYHFINALKRNLLQNIGSEFEKRTRIMKRMLQLSAEKYSRTKTIHLFAGET